jgi:Rab9 effector protein with kelch motifs
VFLFGGCGGENDAINCLNDMYTFDLDLHRWEAVSSKGDVTPSARASFGMCAGPTPNTLIIAGGTGVEMDSLRSDVMEFDTRVRTWSKVTGGGDDAPSRFYGQTICKYGDILLLFGGSTGLHYTNDLYEYNVGTNWWRKLATTGKRPSPRYKHQGLVVGSKMYVIGGGCFKPEAASIDLYCLDLETLVWEEPSMSGDIPKARVAHSCSFDEETSTIYLWGGFTGELSRLQDFFSFNTQTAEWSEIKLPPAEPPVAPAGAANHPANSSGAPCAPYARAFHSAVFHKGALYVFSGANGDVRYNDVWRYAVRSTPPSLGVLAARALLHSRAGVQQMMNLETFVPQEVLEGVLNMNENATRV